MVVVVVDVSIPHYNEKGAVLNFFGSFVVVFGYSVLFVFIREANGLNTVQGGGS
jgi:hypothetical protein